MDNDSSSSINLGILSEPSLVGREREVLELEKSLEQSQNGKETVIIVSGEAGAGKTKLITDFIDIAKGKGITTLTGWCLSDMGIAYFPFVEAFSTYFSSNPGGDVELEVNSWLKGPVRPGLSGTVEISPETWKDLTFAAVRKALTEICGKSPTILFLDDLQWADSGSLSLLHYIVRAMSSQRLLILAAYRSEELKQSTPLLELLRQIKRENFVKEIKLSGLGISDVALIAQHMIGGSIEKSFAERLQKDSQGNPLFVVESIRMLSEKQCLVRDKEQWNICADGLGIPAKIKDIILSMASKLKPEERIFLDTASAIGTVFNPDLLADVLGQDRVKALGTLNGIANASSLVVCEGIYYKFYHAKCRDAIYEEIAAPIKRLYHIKIAEILEKQPEKAKVSDLAYHYARAGDNEKAIGYSLDAGIKALSSSLVSEAIEHFQYVIRSTSDEQKFRNEKESATEGLGDALFAIADSDAIKVFEQLAKDTDSMSVKVRALRKAARASLVQGNYAHALELIRRPINTSTLDRLESARFCLVRGMVEAWGGYSNEALQDLQEALETFERENSVDDLIDALLEIGTAYMGRTGAEPSKFGHPEKALAAHLRALALCKYTRNVSKQFYASVVAFVTSEDCGLHELSEKIVSEAWTALQKIGDLKSRDSNEPWYHWMAGLLIESKAVAKLFSPLPQKLTGLTTRKKASEDFYDILSQQKPALETAVTETLKALPYVTETDFYEIQAFVYGNLVRQYALLGKQAEAEKYANELDKITNQTTLSQFILAHMLYLFTKSYFFDSKDDWNRTNESYLKVFNYYDQMRLSLDIEARVRQAYVWALLRQGQFSQAKKEYEISHACSSELKSRFIRPNIFAYILVPPHPRADQEFSIRLDIINTSLNPVTLIEVKDFLPEGLELVSVKPLLSQRGECLDTESMQLEACGYEAITLTVKATSPLEFTLAPKIVYLDSLKQKRTSSTKPLQITIQSQTKSSVELTANPLVISTGTQNISKPFNVFLCYKKSTGKDFADHLKSGLEESGIHTFLDSKDIPHGVEGDEGWAKIRDQALLESKYFVLVMTPGFNLSSEVLKEVFMARKQANKTFVFFRLRTMGRKTVLKLMNEELDIGRLEQVSFETKEELLRLAHSILLK